MFFFSLGLFKYADAHVTINPKVVEPGSYEKWMFEYLLNKKIILKSRIRYSKKKQASNIQPVEGYKYSLDKDKKVISQNHLERKDKGIGPMNLSNSPLL